MAPREDCIVFLVAGQYLDGRVAEPHGTRNGFEQYLVVNRALMTFGGIYWPTVANIQFRTICFLYDNLATMFLETSDYNRYWICNARHEFWKNRLCSEGSADGSIEWSGRKDMREGDLVFMYGSDPVKAITDVFEVSRAAYLNPYGGWGGFSIQLQHLCEIPDRIPFAEMRKDSVLKN